MGCALSSAQPPASPGSAARRAVAAQQQPLRRGPGDPSNRTVTPSAPWAEPTPLTQQQLQMKRAAFWETTASGRPIVWSNLRVAAEAMLAGDYELASTVLAAADIRVPHADLSLAYDSLGAEYVLPRHVYSTPVNILSHEDFQRLSAGGGGGGGGAAGRSSRGGAAREFGGPHVALPLTLRICATPSSPEQDVKLSARSGDSVGALKQALHEHLRAGRGDPPPEGGDAAARPTVWPGGLPPARQRVMYRGRELGDELFLWDAGLRADGGTLQIFVRQPPA